MFSNLGCRFLENRRIDARLTMFYKIVCGLVAIPLPSYFVRPEVYTRHMHSLSNTCTFSDVRMFLIILPFAKLIIISYGITRCMSLLSKRGYVRVCVPVGCVCVCVGGGGVNVHRCSVISFGVCDQFSLKLSC